MAERPQFIDQLQRKWAEGKFACVGLDPDYSKLPPYLAQDFKYFGVLNYNMRSEVTEKFLHDIVDATADTVSAFKPNIAFFEDQRNTEISLRKIVGYIHAAYPDVPVIGDVKRADIGNTNNGYARMAFDKYGFDAITTNPYFGHDTYNPFLKYPGKGLIVLCKTTNPGAAFYQDAPVNLYEYQDQQELNGTPLSDQEMDLAEEAAEQYYEQYKERILADPPNLLPLYQIIALRTATLAKNNPNIGLVVGATHPEAFAPVRMLAGETTFLIPGIGTQGGDLEKTLQSAPNSKGEGIIINSSSGIIFASKGPDFADAARSAALKLHNQIKELRPAV